MQMSWSSGLPNPVSPQRDDQLLPLSHLTLTDRAAAAYERRSLGIGSHWPFEDWGRFLPEHTTAVSLLNRLLHHAIIVATQGESYRMKQAHTRGTHTKTTTT